MNQGTHLRKGHPAAIRLERELQDTHNKIEKTEQKYADLRHEERSLTRALEELNSLGIYGNVGPDEEKERQLNFTDD